MNKQRKTSNLINIIKYNEEDNNILDLENKEFNIDGDIYPLPNGTPSQIATLDDIPAAVTPTLQEVTDEGNEIVSDDNLNKIVIDKVSQAITFYARYLITDPWLIASQVAIGGYYVDPTGTYFGGTTVSLDVFTGLTISDDFLNGINITSISATKNGVEFATLDDIPTNTSDLVNDGEDGTSPYVTANQLPSNLNLFATNVLSDIATYFKLVTSIDDPDYNDTAVDIPTGAITTTGQFIAALATTANVLVGNPGIINLLTIGNVRRTSGTGTAEFYYEVYHRTSGGTETLIATSSNTTPVSAAIYTEFLAAALLNNGTFLATDRIVVKYYADRIAGGSNPSYDFQFGGASPVRTTFPVPASNIPLDATPTDGSTSGVQSNGVFDALALKQDSLGYTPENVANKATNLTSPDNTKYPTTQAVVDGLATKFTLPALTNGSVLFSNGSTLAQDNANLFWDDTNNRLGIGTNVPANTLDVKGVIRAFNDNGSSSITIQTTGGVGYRDASLNLIGGSQGSNNFSWISDGLNNYFKNGISSTGSFRIRNSTNTDVFFVGFNGNVLINSTSDTTLFRLDVNGTTRLNGNTSIGGSTPGARLDVRAQGALSTDIAFRVRNSADSANLVTVQGNGNVGIGTATPIALLETFSNTINIAGAFSCYSNTATDESLFYFRRGRGTLASPLGVNSGDVLGSLRFAAQFNSTIGNYTTSAKIDATASQNHSITNNGTNLSFYNIANNSNSILERMRIFNGGNVQIQNGGTFTDIASARLAVNSTTQGFLPPRMTTTEKNAIASPAAGLVVYDSTLNKLCVRTASAWETITSI